MTSKVKTIAQKISELQSIYEELLPLEIDEDTLFDFRLLIENLNFALKHAQKIEGDKIIYISVYEYPRNQWHGYPVKMLVNYESGDDIDYNLTLETWHEIKPYFNYDGRSNFGNTDNANIYRFEVLS